MAAGNKKQESKKKAAPRPKVKKTAKKTSGKAGAEGKAAAAEPKKAADFPIVAVGASAGGLEAIEGFFGKMPKNINAAFVIIQHLPAGHKSLMPSLLQRDTDMPVKEAADGIKLQAGHVYLNPADRDMRYEAGRLHLAAPDIDHARRLPIDIFFRSLAQTAGDKSICVVLSGTGTDGTLGLKAIKAAGGMAIAQAEDQAKYDSMPRSAIDTGVVDRVLPVEKMGDQIARYIKHPYISAPEKEAPEPKVTFEDHLQSIFAQVRAVTGHDFSQYKRNTIRRRIERRMAVHQITEVKYYVSYLQQHPDEVRVLFKDLLITVTSFFRDPEAWEALEEQAVAPLLKAGAAEGAIRVWVPGCATGEEAYSVAIVFADAMRKTKKLCNVQIFATDIDAEAIDTARAGKYPDSIAADVSADRLKRYFTKEGDAYKVRKHIRETVVFAPQNLVKDPPFSKLDLVCCRNLLIYMESALQKKVLGLFNYTLNAGGYLFLGTSESIGSGSEYFNTVDTKQKIFRRKEGAAYEAPGRGAVPIFHEWRGETEAAKRAAGGGRADIRELAQRTIIQAYAPPCVLVDEDFDVLYFHGDMDKFLTLPEGEPSFNLLSMARPEMRYQLGTLLHNAVRGKKESASQQIPVRWKNATMDTKVVVRHVPSAGGREYLMMVVFEAQEPAKETGLAKKGRKAEPRVAALEQELASTKEYLQTTIEELETSNEELKSTNEELQSTNEELQSTNEELETSREELQSTNEELSTVNVELQNKVEELSNSNDDLNNLLGAEIAAVFLDNDLRVKRFTPKAPELFSLIDSDIGRPITDVANMLEYEDAVKDMRAVAQNLGRVEKEVRAKDGRWFIFRVLPYRTTANAIEGVAVTLVDITGQKKSQIEAKDLQDFAESVVETVREPLMVLDNDLRVISVNRSFCRVFRVKADESEGKLIYDLGNRQWDIPELRRLLEEILPKNTAFNDFEVEHDFPNIGKRKMRLNARRLLGEEAGTERILLAIEED